MSLPLLVAQLTRVSDPLKLNEPRLDSVASHFIEFSGVSWPNSVRMTLALELMLRVLESAQVPQNFLPLLRNLAWMPVGAEDPVAVGAAVVVVGMVVVVVGGRVVTVVELDGGEPPIAVAIASITA